MYPELWGKLSALIVFVGFNLTFFPQFVLGYLGMPRRYYEYPPEFQVLNVMSTAGASILAVGYVLPLVYLLLSLASAGQTAGPNPWRATGLEWQTDSPPPIHNFEETPVVTAGPYAYSPEEAEDCPWGQSTITSTDADDRADPHAPVRRPGAAAGRVEPRHVDVPGHRGDVLRRPHRGLCGLPGTLATRVRAGQPASQALDGGHQHRRPARAAA